MCCLVIRESESSVQENDMYPISRKPNFSTFTFMAYDYLVVGF